MGYHKYGLREVLLYCDFDAWDPLLEGLDRRSDVFFDCIDATGSEKKKKSKSGESGVTVGKANRVSPHRSHIHDFPRSSGLLSGNGYLSTCRCYLAGRGHCTV